MPTTITERPTNFPFQDRKVKMRRVIVWLMTVTLFLGILPVNIYAGTKITTSPKITKAVLVQDNGVKLQWSKVKYARKYKVYRKKENGRYVLIQTTRGRTCYDCNLSYGTTYTYKVKALRKNRSAKTSKLKKLHTKPAKPLVSVRGRGKHVLVTWKKTKGALWYKVYRKKAGGKYVFVRKTKDRCILDKNLKYETTYIYKVKAVIKSGKTNTSTEKKIMTWSAPVIPSPADPPEPEQPETPEEPDVPDIPDPPEEPQPEHPVEPEVPSEPELPEEPIVPEPDQPSEPETPDIPEPEPEEPEEPAPDPEPEPVPPEKTVTVMIPIYAEDTVYWIKSIDTGEILYQTTDAAAFEVELLTRPEPDTWHWGSGGVTIITGYDVITMTESEWAESWYNGQSDVIVIESQCDDPRSC